MSLALHYAFRRVLWSTVDHSEALRLWAPPPDAQRVSDLHDAVEDVYDDLISRVVDTRFSVTTLGG